MFISHGMRGNAGAVRIAQAGTHGNKVPNDRFIADGRGHIIDQTMRDEVFKLLRLWFTKQDKLKN